MVNYEEEEEELSTKTNISVAHSIHYGRMKLFCNNDYCHLSLGPDYYYFVVSFTIILIISILGVYTALHYHLNYQILTVIINIIPPLTYLNAALSNPGIFDPNSNLEPKTKYCNRCRAFIPRNCHHCLRCDICIEGYDHHCVWISKCIGKQNIMPFYVTAISIPACLLYNIVMAVFSLL